MKLWLPVLFSCCLLAGCASNSGQSPSPGDVARNPSASPSVAGNYVGKWTASDGATGMVRISLKKPAADSPWVANVKFTYEDDEAATTMKTVEISGAHVHLTYDYDIQGTKGGADVSGDLAGDDLRGSYKITMGDGNPGTWTASRVP